ncbi:putative helicase MOV-10 [Ostrinia furnacalis]|uniref:putative helicase MOV-10 n=1 Tax=Ostrinia furnacalis TaxID=93504 RepID=UPI00103E6D1F|nr:putative helicase MOV-10 [Ostrinia furnacalis]
MLDHDAKYKLGFLVDDKNSISKEKCAIDVSTVNASCGLLDHDAKYKLGFLVDDKNSISKEKCAIDVSTVRASCGLLDHDAKYKLGFLVDDKRFNVAITRAKAKAIIIGNPLCLGRDAKWRALMDRCRELGTYAGHDANAANPAAAQDDMLQRLRPVLKELKINKGKA